MELDHVLAGSGPTATVEFPVPIAVEDKVVCQQADSVQASHRLAGMEWLRLIACLGIVWFHIGCPGALIAYGGLPALTALAVALAATPNRRMGMAEVLTSRFQRMMVPWLFWSVVYGLAKVAQALLQDRPVLSEFGISMLLTGPVIHLWFLPFCFVVTATVRILAIQRLLQAQGSAWIGYAIAGGLLVTGCSWLQEHAGNLCVPAQWVFVLPSVVMGLALAARPATLTQGIAVCLINGIGCGAAVLLGYSELAVPYLAGGTACGLACNLQIRASSLLVKVAGLSFAVYLVHPLVMRMLLIVLADAAPALLVGLVVVLSLVAAWVLQATRLRAFT